MKPRRRVLRWTIVLCLLLIAVEAAALVRLTVASNQANEALATVTEAREQLKTRAEDARMTVADGASIRDAADAVLITANAKAGVVNRTDALEASVAEADTTLIGRREQRISRSWLPWEMFARATALDKRADLALDDADAANVLMRTIQSQQAEVGKEIAAVSALAVAAAPGIESSHRSARNDTVLALRDASTRLAALYVYSPESAPAYLALTAAAGQVISSHDATLAENAGPLFDNRQAVENFARELAPDVLMDFTWSRIVNGAGEGGSLGGYATWWYDRGGYASIELSDSVAESWPSFRARALVAHEVGHAVTVRCNTLYDTSTQDSLEDWATAWAISQGFIDDANGTSAYGAPPQEMIDAAAQCR